MEEPNTTDQQPLQPSFSVENTVPEQPKEVKKTKLSKSPYVRVLTFLVSILIVLLILVVISSLSNPKEPDPVGPSPTPAVNVQPTLQPALSVIATSSAFLQTESAAATLSSMLQNKILIDPRLSPPTLNLPLGFSK